MKIIRPLLVILIILALNGAFVLSQVFIWQSSILYLELYEALLEDIHLIDIPAVIFDNPFLYLLISVMVFFTLTAVFLINFNPTHTYTFSRKKIYLNNSFISNNLKIRSPPLK
jgi:hypothetical protein